MTDPALERFFEILRDRDLSLVYSNGQLRMLGPREEITPGIRGFVAAHRKDLIALLAPPQEDPNRPLKQRLYPETPGQPIKGRPILTEAWPASDDIYASALWWRYVGETKWRAYPGRNPHNLPLPAGEELEDTNEATRPDVEENTANRQENAGAPSPAGIGPGRPEGDERP